MIHDTYIYICPLMISHTYTRWCVPQMVLLNCTSLMAARSKFKASTFFKFESFTHFSHVGAPDARLLLHPDQPHSGLRCNSALVCPGGTPGSCGGGLVDTPCSQCREGETWTGSLCEQCGAWRRVLWVVMLVCTFAFLTLAYYLTTSKAGFKKMHTSSNNTSVHN